MSQESVKFKFGDLVVHEDQFYGVRIGRVIKYYTREPLFWFHKPEPKFRYQVEFTDLSLGWFNEDELTKKENNEDSN